MTSPNTTSRKLAKPLNTYEGRNVIPELIGWMLMHPFQMARLYGVPATRMVSQQYGEAKAKTFSRVMSCSVGQKASVKFLGDLIQLSEDDLLNLENFGKRSLYEVRDVVASFSLKLGEDINRDLYFEQRKKKEETEVSEDVG